MYSYNKLYLARARRVMAGMLDYAVHVQKIGLKTFYNMFLNSCIAAKFSAGDPFVIAGKSGPELVLEVLTENNMKYKIKDPEANASKSAEYWCGYYLAYYQWYSGLSFEKINSFVTIEQIKKMYPKYHEMDVRQFADSIDEKRAAARLATYLQLYRKRMGYSQKELSEFSGVPLKSIQQYEQRQKNINKAAAETVICLSRVLNCKPSELLE